MVPVRILFWGCIFFLYYLLFFDFCSKKKKNRYPTLLVLIQVLMQLIGMNKFAVDSN